MQHSIPKSTPKTVYPSVYIILLTYQMRDVVERCLFSLKKLTYANLRIIVVDNDSNDGGIREKRFFKLTKRLKDAHPSMLPKSTPFCYIVSVKARG